jgi:leukotriene A-4 hydrolase/aminopeptidase
MKRLLWLLLLGAFACKQPSQTESSVDQQPVNDPHTFSNSAQAVAKHLDLNIKVDFSTQQLTGKASWTIDNISGVDNIIFDTWKMQIQKVTLGDDEKATNFQLGKEVQVFGQPLTINIDDNTKKVNIYYTTSKDASALQWLTPQQTSGKKHPFLFTQSQPILARSWVPCQDGPAVRFTYNATVKVPAELMAVMSAENAQKRSADGIYHFKQPNPIPSYLMALAVGDIAFKAVDKRTGVYAEPSVVDKAAWEFADMGKMVDAAEKLYGPYRWGRYDLLVLPPSFPYGGMENPMLTFATPTVIAGDRSLVSLVAHELAHSWSGNLVTNATWNDMWLNEGFTVYFERRIIEALYGKAEFQMQEVIGRQDLMATIEDLGDTSRDTRLKLDLAGRDPDEGLSDVAYEKGYAFLRTIEENVGRAAFDEFLKSYFNKHAFQSRTTEQFLKELTTVFKNKVNFAEQVRIKEWVYGPGIPNNIPPAVSAQFSIIDTIITNWQKTKQIAGMNQQLKSTNQLLYFIRQLPATITAADMALLDKEFKFSQSGNAEIQTAWYTWAIQKQYKPAYSYIESFLSSVGRRKFLRPLYGEMIKTTEGKAWARQIYATARANYHPVAYTTIDAMLK